VSIILPSVQLDLQTRRRNQIKNRLDRVPVLYGERLSAEAYKKQYPSSEHRPVGPCATYNCHGLTFACRRASIWEISEIQKILLDDEYVQIERKMVLTGDIAIYYSTDAREPEHSGWVVRIDPALGPIILSKWGKAHEVIHSVPNCPYDAGNVRFYRINT